MAEVRFLVAAIEDLQRLSPDIRLRVLNKVRILEEDPKAGHPLGGTLTGYRKLVVGDRNWRIVYRETNDGDVEVCEIWVVGARTADDVYREAAARTASLPPGPAAQTLARVLHHLGYEPEPEPEPITPPAWLIARLVHTAGLDPADVAAMTLDDALQAWTDYQTRPS